MSQFLSSPYLNSTTGCSTADKQTQYPAATSALPLMQVVIAVMYFTRWHVSSEFLSVAIASQVTMRMQYDSTLLQDTVCPPTCTLLKPPAAVHGAAFAGWSQNRRRHGHTLFAVSNLWSTLCLTGAPPVLAHPVLGASLPAAEQQVRPFMLHAPLDQPVSPLHWPASSDMGCSRSQRTLRTACARVVRRMTIWHELALGRCPCSAVLWTRCGR
jgi:hypothetical protein